MSVSTSALTLAQYAIMSNDPLVRKISYSLLENGSVLQDIPMLNQKSMIANGVRWEGNLPTVNWAKLNTDPTVTSGTPKPYQEQAYLLRNAIDVDKKLVEDVNQIVDPRGAQIGAYLRAAAYDINDKFINNDHVTGDAQSFVGLRYRIANPTVYGVNSDMSIDAGAVDMTTAMTATTANTFIEALQSLMDYLGAPEGDGVTLYMNDLMRRRFERAIRVLGAGAGFTMTKDAFDRAVAMYRNAKIRDIGRKADQTTRIITSTETSAGAAGSDHHTSIYGVRYGDEQFQGWQFDPLQAEDIGLIGNGGTVYRTLIDYAFGLYPQHTRCMGRLFGIKVS